MQQHRAYFTGSVNGEQWLCKALQLQQRTRHEMSKQIAMQNKLKRSVVMNRHLKSSTDKKQEVKSKTTKKKKKLKKMYNMKTA